MDDVVGSHDTMNVEIIDKDAMIAALRQQLADAQAQLAAANALIQQPLAVTSTTLKNIFST